MPIVNGKYYSYTRKGRAAAIAAKVKKHEAMKKKKAQSSEKKKSHDLIGPYPGK